MTPQVLYCSSQRVSIPPLFPFQLLAQGLCSDFGSQHDPVMKVMDFPPPPILAVLKNPMTDLNI